MRQPPPNPTPPPAGRDRHRPQAVAGGLGRRPRPPADSPGVSRPRRALPALSEVRRRSVRGNSRNLQNLALVTVLVAAVALMIWPLATSRQGGPGPAILPVSTLGPGPSRWLPAGGGAPIANPPPSTAEPVTEPATEGIGLGPDGRPTCETGRELQPAQPPCQGDDVRELQARLLQLGLYTGPVDGVYTQSTVAAVRRAQTLAGLPATGVVEERTWMALYRLGEPLLGEEHPQHQQASGSHREPRPAPPAPLSILIDIDRLTLTLFSQGKPFKTYPVAVGEGGILGSPVGEWRVANKDRGWGGGFGSRWLGLNVPWGIYGIHGTNKPWSIGTRASHGCFRMFNEDVEELWDWVPLNTPVIVQGEHPRSPYGRTLKLGSSGKDVVGFQFALRRANLEIPEVDGRFGPVTEAAVRALQHALGWPVTGKAEADLLHFLGLRPLPQL